MNKRLILLPFAAFVALSGYVGWQMGQPLSETDALDFHAADWVNTGPEGAATTDCFGVPGTTADVWITVNCTRGDMTRQIDVAPNGRSVIRRQEPQT